MSFNEYFSEYFSFNEYFSAISRTSLYLQSCNSNKTFISQIYIELSVIWEKSLIFSAPGDLKVIATLITKPWSAEGLEINVNGSFNQRSSKY